jgi:HEAT repeat protein
MRLLAFSLLAIAVLPGCGRQGPPLSGGKPVSYWLGALKDGDAKLRLKAITKLGNVGATEAAVLPALIEALKDVDASVRRASILALMKLEPAAKEAMPILTEVQRNDRDAEVRVFASKALDKLAASN